MTVKDENKVKVWIMGAVIACLVAVCSWLMIDKITNNDRALEELTEATASLREDVLIKLSYIDGKNALQDSEIKNNSDAIAEMLKQIELNTEFRLKSENKESNMIE